MCVASQGKLSKTSLSLALTGLDNLFPETARFSAYSVANGKPAPDLLLHAAASMGVKPVDTRIPSRTKTTVSGCRTPNIIVIK